MGIASHARDPLVVNRLRQILEPTRTEEEHEAELLDDHLIWFSRWIIRQDRGVMGNYKRQNPPGRATPSSLTPRSAVTKLDDVEWKVKKVLRQNSAVFVEVAHRLVVSAFFFEKDMASVKLKASGFTYTGILSGSIFCNFRLYSAEIKALVWFLISLLDGDFEPYFVLEGDYNEGAVWPVRQILVLTESVIQDMHLHEPIRIHITHKYSNIKLSLCLQSAPYTSGVYALPISGFPRRLMLEDGDGVHQAVLSMNGGSTVQR
ncbi:hypothetical protein FHL15_011157 [Xylaria flabelliformis]|uniref:Uncharacterized protein n=1 Tax=Xylaria flabelliformis TaxID=2512241 RepID=A0A553HJ50_9PEZI|nr:hypothetical protein FHL15_011157 [Xylaria flabelliformis]